jgi:hypothetical protein
VDLTHNVTPDPQYDLVSWVEHQQATGDNEVDPYSYAITLMRIGLEFALDDGINGAMSEREFEILKTIARTICELDPHVEIEPRIG